jgi:hypothetical protein
MLCFCPEPTVVIGLEENSQQNSLVAWTTGLGAAAVLTVSLLDAATLVRTAAAGANALTAARLREGPADTLTLVQLHGRAIFCILKGGGSAVNASLTRLGDIWLNCAMRYRRAHGSPLVSHTTA